MGHAFKRKLVSGNLTLADCCSCVPGPHSCWREGGVGGGGRGGRTGVRRGGEGRGREWCAQ